MKIKRFHEPVYNTHLLLMYDCKAVEAENYLNEKHIVTGLRKCSGQTGTYTVTKNKQSIQTRYYIYVEKEKDPVKALNTLVHEICHLVFVSLLDCGIRVSQETDEIFAYYFGWWFERLYPSIK